MSWGWLKVHAMLIATYVFAGSDHDPAMEINTHPIMTSPTPNLLETEFGHSFAAAMQSVNETANRPLPIENVFATVLEQLREGVIYIDLERTVQVWNPTAEKLTGVPASGVVGFRLTDDLLGLHDHEGNVILSDDSPIERCFHDGLQHSGEFRILGRSGRETKVEATIGPVWDDHQAPAGVVIIFNDASVQFALERQIKEIFEISMVDPLTKVHNRAEFERVLDQFVKAKYSTDFNCSLIICDIDFFKGINDNYNHHVGDQTLVAFARLLKKFVRNRDLVARYGGEEFVVLCCDCDLASAVQRAEDIRLELTKTKMPMLGDKCITASFGVAELQIGESATDFFVRADSAMIKAKETGRNRVVEAGKLHAGKSLKSHADPFQSSVGLTWIHKVITPNLFCEEFITTTPVTMLATKLGGYVEEVGATILKVEPDYAKLQIQVADDRNVNRKGNFVIEIEFLESKTPEVRKDNVRCRPAPSRPQTFIRITISEVRKKWFGKNADDLASLVMRELRRYFMIAEETAKLTIERAVTKSTR